ncbi:MAG: enoyl-CoA hydratase/isomerase family protein [Rhodopirellula sp.]|nr:enoyl-CoA hydratase/isomerase family protein [Rhodopirellula sp.]
MADMWHPEKSDDGILRVTIDRKDRPVSALSRSMMEELRELVQSIKSDSSIRGVLFQSGKPGVFIAGADITEFENLTDKAAAEEVSAFGQGVFQELENLKVPTVALISGACLGGGLEFALACRYRVASTHEKTKLGLPEVQLGLLPGWGGTVRLPRQIGLIDALPLVLSGRQLGGFQARSKGVVHEVVPIEALASVGEKIIRTHHEFGSASKLFSRSKKPGWQKFLEGTTFAKKFALKKARQEVMSKTHGHYPAPLQIIETFEKGLSADGKRQFRIESDGISKLAANPVTRECIRLFFLSEEAKKPPKELEATFHAKGLKRAAVVGAGAMGAGIALLLARKGIATRLNDIKPEFVARGVKTVRDLLGKDTKRKKLTKRQAEEIFDRLSPATDYRGLNNADVVIEAVVEVTDVKRQVFAELAEATNPQTVLATNTSSLLVSEIARDVPHPERVVGLHFFNPPHQMPLVEVIRTDQTSDEALAKAFAVVQRLGKTPVVVGDCAGFLVNRLLGPYMNEAGFLLAEVADPMEIDKAAVDFGMPMGPLALSDLVGLDVAAHVADNLYQAYGERMKPASIWGALKQLREKLGSQPKLLAKDGRSVQESVLRCITGLRKSSGSTTGTQLSREAIAQRLVFPVINEAAICLAEGVARRPEDIDLAMVFGTGFAPFRGGPLRYAESIGLQSVVDGLDQLAKTYSHLAPSDALRKFARSGTFTGDSNGHGDAVSHDSGEASRAAG